MVLYYWQERAVFCHDLWMGMHVFGVDVDRIHFKIMLLLRLKCSVVDTFWCGAALVMTTSLILLWLDKL